VTRKEKEKFFRQFHKAGRKLLRLNDIPIKIKFTDEANYGITTSPDNTRSRFIHNFNVDVHQDVEEIRDTVIHELLEIYTWPLLATFYNINDDDKDRNLIIDEKEHIIGRLTLVLRDLV